MQLKKCQLLAMVVAGSIIITVLTILFLFNYPSLVRERTINDVIFRNGTVEWPRFVTTKDLVNLRLEFYVFNVTNPNQVVNNSAVIKLEEIGPFVYHEFKYREIISIDNVTGLIKYKLRKRYTFQRHLSAGDSKDIIITWPNVPLLAAKSFLDRQNIWSRTASYFIINSIIRSINEPAFITDSVDNFIFNGSKRLLFETLQDRTSFLHIKPWPLKDNKFGLLYGKNDTWDPERDYIFATSAGFGSNYTYRDLNRYVTMNDSQKLPFWGREPSNCNELGGTDGEFFSPFLNQSENIEVYSIDICRKIQLRYRQNSYSNGVPVWKYSFDEASLQSGSKNPLNKCYCLAKNPDGSPKEECLLDGLIDLSTCISPNIVASGAHFTAGSPELRSRLEGISEPNSSIHEPTLYIEPNTGLTLVVKVPLQFNVRLEKSSFVNFRFFNDSQPLIVPLVWVSEDAEMTPEQAALLKSKLLLLDSWLVLAVLGGAIIFISAIIVVATIICVRYRHSRASLAEIEQVDERSPLCSERRGSTSSGSISNNRGQNNPRNYRSM